jgi:hypothetical protein
MVALMTSADAPRRIRSCWLSWVAVQTCDQGEVMSRLGVANPRQVSWARGTELVDEIAHCEDRRLSTVVVTPAIEGWTLVVGLCWWVPLMRNHGPLTDLCKALSGRFGKAQAYLYCEQGDGDAWMIAEDGRVIRRWIDEVPPFALGDPFGVERQFLDAYGIPGKPEDLNWEDGEEDEKLMDWIARGPYCLARDIAAESSLDPTAIGPAAKVSGLMLVADAPALDYPGLQAEQLSWCPCADGEGRLRFSVSFEERAARGLLMRVPQPLSRATASCRHPRC